MPWVYLFAAGLFEVAWAVALNRSQGFTRAWPSVAFVEVMAVRLIL